jgi:simple sugar transport system ATP-binding protein
MLLELENVRKVFGHVEALKEVSFGVEAGEVLGLVGDNGAGKSTLMKIVTGVYEPSAGSVRFEGRSLSGADPGRTRELGIEMIYQDLALARQQDVASNIFLGREPMRRVAGVPVMVDHDGMRQKAREMIESLGASLPSVRTAVGNLSGGQQQSVAIARALTFAPKMVIMDEPTAALAVKEVDHVLDLIRRLRDRGITVILISHRLTDVFAVTDRIVVLRQGKVETQLATEETDTSEVVAYIVGAK